MPASLLESVELKAHKKCRTAKPSGILESTNQQKLNCALPFRFSLSSGFFRFQSLHGISEIPKEIGLSRRPTARNWNLRPDGLDSNLCDFSLERR
jgi:hypothetical protein